MQVDAHTFAPCSLWLALYARCGASTVWLQPCKQEV